jgi:uncharacterized membrane protein
MEKLKSYIPRLDSRWWTGLLAISLIANLLIGGALVGRNFSHNQDGLTQLVPRRFVDELPRERRREIMDVLRNNRQDMRALRQEFEANALALADALDAPIYDPSAVKTLIEKFSTGNQSVAARSAAVVMELVEKLTPEERKQLAAAMRMKRR